MAEDKKIEETKETGMPLEDTGKPTEVNPDIATDVAPPGEKPTEEVVSEEAPDTEDIDDVLIILNTMDELSGGKGSLSGIPDELRGSISYLIEKLKFVRDMFEDPYWKQIMDDLADQREDGNTPSVEVAIARTIPIEKLIELADNEDYEGVQKSLSESLANKKSMKEEDKEYEGKFSKVMENLDTYASNIGYDDTQKQELAQFTFDLIKIIGDGDITVDEFAKVDKMRNYDKDTEDLRKQIGEAPDTKEVLPDQASIESGSMSSPKAAPAPRKEGPGMESMIGMGTPAFLQTGRKRFNK